MPVLSSPCIFARKRDNWARTALCGWPRTEPSRPCRHSRSQPQAGVMRPARCCWPARSACSRCRVRFWRFRPGSIRRFRSRHRAEPREALGSAVGSALSRHRGALPLLDWPRTSPYPFTPAGTANRPTARSPWRCGVDPVAAQAISVRGQPHRQLPKTRYRPSVRDRTDRLTASGLRAAISSFALEWLAPRRDCRAGRHPRSRRVPQSGGAGADNRAGSAAPDRARRASRPPVAAPRTFAGDAEDRVDVGGSYRLTRNLDVTAGVRYSQERDRSGPADRWSGRTTRRSTSAPSSASDTAAQFRLAILRIPQFCRLPSAAQLPSIA